MAFVSLLLLAHIGSRSKYCLENVRIESFFLFPSSPFFFSKIFPYNPTYLRMAEKNAFLGSLS